MLLPFVPRAATIDQNTDPRLSYLATHVAEMLTTHAFATAVMEQEPWDFMAVYYTAIDHFSHAFMYYHPPKLSWISDADYEMYKDVVTGVYRFHDMMLHRLLHLAGPDTTVVLCSDHGFQSRELRPMRVPNEPAAPAYWHRRFGILVASGPNIRKDQRVDGASLLDIAPTILTMLGLPAGQDMDGRPLLEIFETPPEVRTIPTWETVEGESGMHRGDVDLGSPSEASELVNQLVALGYIESPGDNKEEASRFADVECRYNLARNLAACSRYDDAIALMKGLVEQEPWETRFILLLARYCTAAGQFAAAQRVLEAAFDLDQTTNVGARLMWAELLCERGDAPRAAAALRQLEQRPLPPDGLIHVGNCFLRLRQFEDAERAFRRAIELHPQSAEGYQGISTIACRLGRNQEAADAALTAIGLVHRLPTAHLNLGIALARSGDRENAIRALETGLRFNPNMFKAHRLLSMLYRQRGDGVAKAAAHSADALGILSLRAARRQPDDADTAFDLPPLPPEAERERVLNERRPPRSHPGRRSGKCFTLVSGLPRSGTSLMMQMLEAGGLPPKTDGQRSADADNPRGYYEWEAIKTVAAKPQILDEEGLDQKAIKVISMLLPQLPYIHEYRVIFMTRPLDEVVESQAAMIERLGTQGAAISSEQLKFSLGQHRDEALEWLRKHPRAKVLEVDYPTLIRAPETYLDALAQFLGPDLLPNPASMKSVIDRSLYRKRSQAAAGQ